MPQLTNEIREAVRNLLNEGKVDLIIGFERGTMPLRSRPCFIRKQEHVDRLIWDGFCENNLAKYLVKQDERIAIIAKGCDGRTVVELMKENQVDRDQVVIVGVPCQGMVDRKRIEAELHGKAILEAEERGDEILLKGAGFEETLSRQTFLHASCKACTHPNPTVWDIPVGEPAENRHDDTYAEVEAFEALSSEERWAYLSKEVSKCIRCYACRNACPLCYCQECFVDSTQPQWLGKSTDPSDTMVFHLMRAYHLAGRCTECGACERACPVGVDIRKLNRKLAKDIKALFDYEAGLKLEQATPLSTFSPDDPEAFIVNP